MSLLRNPKDEIWRLARTSTSKSTVWKLTAVRGVEPSQMLEDMF